MATAEPAQHKGAPRDAERRQLTVMFCDLVGSTALAGRLDPEELREHVRAYQGVSAEVIARFEGHIAQYLGDGLLVYFGYPSAHEDDAQRAVSAGLAVVDAVVALSARQPPGGVALAVRVGIHTGLVVVGEVGSGSRREQLALGETPNVAARIEALAEPGTVVVSAATHRLVEQRFSCRDLGAHTLRGVAGPQSVYHVLGERITTGRRDSLPAAWTTPLVGREREVALVLEPPRRSGGSGTGRVDRLWVPSVGRALHHRPRIDTVASGSVDGGLTEMRRGLAGWQATGAGIMIPVFLAFIAEAEVARGDVAPALGLIDDASRRIETYGERFYEAELHRLRGEALLANAAPDSTRAESYFLRAIEVARQQQARSFELRTTASLARLWRQRGRGQDAHRLLTEAAQWFSDGLETSDVRDARHLLQELS